MGSVRHTIAHELKTHVPFTFLGTLTGIAILLVFTYFHLPHKVSATLFWSLHPLHVFFSAIATAGMYRLHSKGSLWGIVLVGYVGSVGIGTLSDSVIPFLGECLLNLEHSHAHIGFIEMWWLVNPLAFLGIGIAYFWPRTKIPHAGHVLLSTWASLFHFTMAIGAGVGLVTTLLIGLFLFLAVWVPCCTSDIVFPLLFAKEVRPCGCLGDHGQSENGQAEEAKGH
ncbi:MAG: hypothetical protein ACYTF1_01615 [Planctomycetota bacterium]|jgi:hypothetical protein